MKMLYSNENVAVVILNWNGVGFLEKFLPGVVERSGGARIVVADNGSTDNSLEFLRGFAHSVSVIELGANYGFAKGYNLALERLRDEGDDSKYYILLNSDVEVSEGWVEPLIQTMEENSNVAATQPKILCYDRPTHFEHAGASGGFIDTLGFPFCRGRIMNYCEEDKGQYDDCREIFWATGAAMAIRAEVFDKSGGFDPQFFAHMEEIDLCWRLKRMGYKIMVSPQSVVYHVGGGTLPSTSARKIYLNYRNNLSMLYKNLRWWSFIWVYILRCVMDGMSAVVFFVSGKPKFGCSTIRAHYHFFIMRAKLQKTNHIPKPKVSYKYPRSIILYYILKSKTFKNLL